MILQIIDFDEVDDEFDDRDELENTQLAQKVHIDEFDEDE